MKRRRPQNCALKKQVNQQRLFGETSPVKLCCETRRPCAGYLVKGKDVIVNWTWT